IQQPKKLLRILLDSGRLIFKYGRHLPKILNAGLKALRSFRTATQFENLACDFLWITVKCTAMESVNRKIKYSLSC
ncbi:MAG: hypothetical protein AB8G86_05190, partial [Saprospiraceae bacterium]